MPDIFNRLAILAAAAAVAFAVGAFFGYRYHEGRSLVAENAALTTSISNDVQQTGADNKLAESQGERRVQYQVRSRTVKTKGITDVVQKPKPVVCDLDAVSIGLLNDAIDAANGGEYSEHSDSLYDAVRTDAEADGRNGQGGEPVAVRGD